MVFAMYNATKERLEILSFIFANEAEEEEFKMAIAIKLYETNRQESFAKLLQKKEIAEEDNKWLTDAYQMDDGQGTEYEETEEDLNDLCDDVTMLDLTEQLDANDKVMSQYQAQNAAIADDGEFVVVEDAEREEEEEEERKRNKWEEAANQAYSDEEDLVKHTDSVLPPSPFKDEAPRKGARNRHITGSKMFNRQYVLREQDKGSSHLGYFKVNDENELEYQGKIAVADRKKRKFTPTKMQQFKSDRSMLLLNDKNPGTVYNLNLDKGVIVDEWTTKDGLVDLAPLSKHDEMTDNPMVYGLTQNSMFQIDGRIPQKCKVIDSKQKVYRSIHNLDAMATSGNGWIVTGARDGKIRLHDCVEKKAKTCLPGLGNAIKAIEVSQDGRWILATCSEYIMVIPTSVPSTERTGFEGRGMGKLKPHPYILRLKPKDIQKYGLRKVDFTKAQFDQGRNVDEHWIISSTGQYIVKWNFSKLKKAGIVNSYSIRAANSKVVHNEFRFDRRDDLLVSEQNSVYTQHCGKKKK